jgi:AcrR family transcriptional regulator
MAEQRLKKNSREDVVDAAVAIGDADGLGAVTLSAIAARLGCTPPSLYTHVASLNDLFEALTTRCTRELADQLRDVVMGRAGEDGIRAFAQAWREYARTFPNRYAAIWLGSESENKSRTDAASIGIRAGAAVLRSLGIPEETVPTASLAFRSMLQGFAQIESETQTGRLLPKEADAGFEYLLDVLISGVRDKSSSG